MNILYVVGTGSKWSNNELRFSLRSIAKYGQNIDRVFIVGNKPDFVSNEVGYLPCDDPYGAKHKNIHYKMRNAIRELPLGDHFLISSDDHFYIQDVDFNNYPVYCKESEIPTRLQKGHLVTNYWRSLFETRELLMRNRLPIYQTNPHCNTHIDVQLWRANKHIFKEAYLLPHGGEINCVMGNLMIAHGAKPTPYVDCKVKYFDSIKGLKDMLQDKHCFSIGNEAIQCGIGTLLNELFPDKCKYEK